MITKYNLSIISTSLKKQKERASTKGGLFLESVSFLSSPNFKKKIQKAILSLNIKFPTNNSINNKFKFQAQDSFFGMYFF